MKKIVFATNNQHKLEEVRKILGSEFEVLSLSDIGFEGDIPETGHSFTENAAQKAHYIYERYHLDVIADDSGLEVEALNGEPGVYSARYAGEAHDSEANMSKLLDELGDNENRRAQFCTAIALIQKLHDLDCVWSLKFFTGIVSGEITHERRGGQGFGYDPIFQPDGYDKTFAELGVEVKNQISHRAKATKKLADFLLKK